MSLNLYNRFREQGTLSEPTGIPDPVFALPSTTNWMRCLAFLVKEQKIDFGAAMTFYRSKHVSRWSKITDHQVNSTFERLLFAIHQVAALNTLKSTTDKTDIARVAIVAWYYGIYAAACAMLIAKDGTLTETHADAAKAWARQFSHNKLVISPFDLYVSSLVSKTSNAELTLLKSGVPAFNLATGTISVSADAKGGCLAYLSGTVDWRCELVSNNVREFPEFKKLGVSNFRTKKAQELRDKSFEKHSVCFLHQAYRYRGKANYREALYLGYGKWVKPYINEFIDDLSVVCEAFLTMSIAFCEQRIGSSIFNDFKTDLDLNRAFSYDSTKLYR